jgi:hypothetical protein
MGDEKLTDQIGNTITYFTRAHISNVSEADLDMELDPTDVTKINPEAAAVIGLDEGKSKRRNKTRLTEEFQRMQKLAGLTK